MGPSLGDREFVRAVHDGSLASFHHRDHLRFAWTLLKFHGLDQAKSLVSQGIREYAAAKGASGLFHQTITEFWVRIMHHAMGASSVDDFDSLLQKFPILMDKSIPFRHWTREKLACPEARAGWVSPDILPIPF